MIAKYVMIDRELGKLVNNALSLAVVIFFSHNPAETFV